VSVELSRNVETGFYTEVKEDFEYRINSNHADAVGFERGLLNCCFLGGNGSRTNDSLRKVASKIVMAGFLIAPVATI
jgi:hypothetical protein